MSETLEKFNVFSEISEQFKQNINLFHIFDDKKGKNVLFVTNDDRVYAFGPNYLGKCGFGHDEVVATPIQLTELNGKQVKQFFIGYDFVLASNETNQVFGWGHNDSGQLGRGYSTDIEEYLKPEIIPNLNNIIEISCGHRHSLALDREGNVFSWGKNKRGQVGSGRESGNRVFRPAQLKELPKIKSIHCQEDRSFAVTLDGLVYSWGYNRCLGHQIPDEIIFKPKLIIGLNNVLTVGCSDDNTYFLTDEAAIYFCGRIDSREHQKTPGILETDIKFKSLQTIVYTNYYLKVLALSEERVYYLERNTIQKTNYKTFSDHYLNENQITFKTFVNLRNDSYKQFEEICVVGSGAFGDVVKVRHKTDNKVFAIKMIKVQANYLKEIEKEVNILSKCNEEYVVKYYNSWFENNIFCIKLELFDNNLKNIISEKMKYFNRQSYGVMTTTEYFVSSQLLKELLECVQYLHELKPPIIHRNLKPTNILISYEPRNGRFLKLSDFHLATITAEKTESHTRGVGSLRYMAPEVSSSINGRIYYSSKADIYSLGQIVCVLFDFDLNQYNEQVTNNAVLKSLWSELTNLIEQMLSMRYHERPSCAQILEKSKLWLIDKVEVNHEMDLTQPNSFLYNYMSYKLGGQLTITNENINYFNDHFVDIVHLDSGSYGNVIKAKNKSNEQVYAIKVIEMTIDEKHSLFEYEREVKLILKCSEEYVVKCFNYWIENNKLYIQMELCSDNLKNIIQQKANCFGRKETDSMTTTEFFISSQMFKEILDSIHYLHENSIIHRDLKPANILVNYVPKRDRFLKLADFGLATFCDKTFSQSRRVGTSRYMAPEIWTASRYKPQYSQKTDIFSLGRILSELFDYDMNFTDKYLQNNSELTENWAQLVKLADAMIATIFRSRPTCAKILEEYSFWQMDKAKVDLNLVSDYENKFFYNYIRYQLNKL